MSSAGLLISLPQMVDLAIGSPEIGAVNFNLLGAALQVIIQQLKLNEYTVDFRGPDVERMQGLLATAKPGMSLKISEPTEVEAGTISKDRRRSEEEQIGITGPRRNSKVEPNAGSVSKTQKVIVVEPSTDKQITNLPQVVVGVSQDLFIQINQDVEDLKSKMAEMLELPNNETIIEAVRAQGQDKVTPVIDMWQALSIAKRVESAETGMEKLAGMFENLIHEIGGTGEGGGSVFAEIGSRIDAIEQKISQLEGGGGGTSPGRRTEDAEGDMDEGTLLEIENLKSRLKSLEGEFTNLMKGAKGKNLGEMFRDIEDLKNSKENVEGEEGQESGQMDQGTVGELQEKLKEFTAKLSTLDDTFSSQIDKLQEQLLNIEKELGAILENTNTKTDTVTDATSMGDLFNKIIKLQEDLEIVNKIIDRINEDQDERAITIDALTEQLELLKTTKADREDLEDALADKADTQQMNRKVSTLQFDAACEDITRHIEDTVKKLSEQEEMWQSTLDELQVTIGAKLDKQEFDPLRDFVNRKIKSLQQRLKALLAMKQEQEAAGTKSKILKNVNCISCDKDVIMYKDNKFSTLPAPLAMPGNRSIKPYITYELDAVRKQQKSLPQGRNMNFLESAIQEEKPKKDKLADKALPPGHLCNRYCGGSHTMTQPQQRVAHIGHFLNQWGPQAIPLTEEKIMGADGQMYKARDASGDAPKPIIEEIRRLSAQIQTEEQRDKVPRMSSTIEPIKREKSARLSKGRSSSSKQVTVDGDQLEPVKEEAGEDESKRKSTSRSSVRKSARKSSSATVPKQASAEQERRRSSTSKGGGTPRQSLKKSQVSLKRLSQSQGVAKESAREDETPAEGEEAPAEPATEAPAEESPPEPPAENPEEPPPD